ncbi:hypothetical protein [Actinoplanes sp. NBRC 103695]|uniref:hypothetical protein n=1 Tax=Actinoplanes sp. NBRC 103695 TaxID=3032202 RepID=UPI0024A0CD8B|nr:hypothetical protein [Actinoplanes sp. NBRC 103695]GLY98760.1 hypothetical protein Acsp02_60140 [Actinoplanes sp. NBRC 103695]
MPPPDGSGQVTESEQQLTKASQQVSEQHSKVGDELNRLIDAVNGAMNKLSDWSWLGGLGGAWAAHKYAGKVHDLMEKIKKQIEDILKVVKEILDKGVPVISLITKAFAWLNTVQAPVGAMSDTAAQFTANFNNWDGPAKRAYDQRVPIQVKAIDGLAGAAGEMALWLSDLAAANAAYIVSCFKPLFDMAGVIAAAVVDAATIAGALEALGKCGELVQTAINSLYEQLENATNHVTGVINKMVEAKKIQGELGDSWPQMVTL